MISHNHVLCHDRLRLILLQVSLMLLLQSGIVGKDALRVALGEHRWSYVGKGDFIARNLNFESIARRLLLNNDCRWQFLTHSIRIIILIRSILLLYFLPLLLLLLIVISLQRPRLKVNWFIVAMALWAIMLHLINFFFLFLGRHSSPHEFTLLQRLRFSHCMVLLIESSLSRPWNHSWSLLRLHCASYPCTNRRWRPNYWAIRRHLWLRAAPVHNLGHLLSSDRVVNRLAEETTRVDCLSLGYCWVFKTELLRCCACRGVILWLLLIRGWRRDVLSVALRNATLSHLLDALFLLPRLIHSFQLLLHRPLLPFRSGFGGCGLVRSCWLVRDIGGESALLCLLFILILLLRLLRLISLVLTHFVEPFIGWTSISSSSDVSCLSRCNLRGKGAFFQLTCLLSLLRFIFPRRCCLSLLLR